VQSEHILCSLCSLYFCSLGTASTPPSAAFCWLLTVLHLSHSLLQLQFGDGFNATIGGVLRGAGRQELGALLNLLSYW